MINHRSIAKCIIAIFMILLVVSLVTSLFGNDDNATAENQYDFAPNFVSIGNGNDGFHYYYDADTNVVYVTMSKSSHTNGLSPVYKADGTLMTLEELLANKNH